MGVIKRGILGGFSGKVGSIVGSSWKGIAVIKSLPLSVANPRTAAQTTQRTAFKSTSEFAIQILGNFIKPLWDRFASKMSGFNAFMQINVKQYNQNPAYPYGLFFLARGKMTKTLATVTPPIAPAKDFVIDWTATGDSGLQLATDQMYALVYSALHGNNIAVVSTAVRADGTVTVSVPNATVIGEPYRAVLVAKRIDGTVVSDDENLGMSPA